MINVLITTKNAPFTGIIVPIGYKFMPEVLKYIKDTHHNVYIAKHCSNANSPTHISKGGIVNRYGWFLTNETLFSENAPITESIDLEKGWFHKLSVNNINNIDRLNCFVQ